MKSFFIKSLAVILGIGILVVGDGSTKNESEVVKERKELADLITRYAHQIAESLAQSPSGDQTVKQLALESRNLSEFSHLVRRKGLPHSVMREIDNDVRAKQLFESLDLGNYENMYELVLANLYCYETEGTNCDSDALVQELHLANVRSEESITNKPVGCEGGIDVSDTSILIYDEPFSYLIHYGLCRATGIIWTYDGETGWRFATKERLFRLCLSKAVEEHYCSTKQREEIHRLWEEDHQVE